MTKAQVIARIKVKMKAYPTARAAAAALNVAPSQLGEVLMGRRDPGPQLLEAMGLQRVTTYTEVMK